MKFNKINGPLKTLIYHYDRLEYSIKEILGNMVELKECDDV